MSLIAVVDDLFFSVRIGETARRLGLELEIVPTAKLGERLARGGVNAVILDLGAASALNLLRALKSDPEAGSTPVVGFASHVAAETMAAARAAGCDRVLARSAFTRELPQLLGELGSIGRAKGRSSTLTATSERGDAEEGGPKP